MENMSWPVTQCPQKGSREVNSGCILASHLLIHSATLDHGMVPATLGYVFSAPESLVMPSQTGLGVCVLGDLKPC